MIDFERGNGGVQELAQELAQDLGSRTPEPGPHSPNDQKKNDNLKQLQSAFPLKKSAIFIKIAPMTFISFM